MIRIINAEVLEGLHQLPAKSIQCCVTSPPYWGLRDYGVDGQIGLEKTPEEYVAKLVEVFREVGRVLRDDGTLWLNLGDTYAASRSYQVPDNKHPACDEHHKGAHFVPEGLKQKDLIGIPWRVAFALQADGWYLRSDIIWSKPNPMPESVTDRPTKSHEYIFLLTKKQKYYYDADAVREKGIEKPRLKEGNAGESAVDRKMRGFDNCCGTNGTRNKRSVWEVTTQPFPEAHFATFPEALIEPCIKAGSKMNDVVLDPFGGSGTTAKVARDLNRDAVLIEINPEYVKIMKKRLRLNEQLVGVEP